MSGGEDVSPDKHANSDSLRSAEADHSAVGTASNAEAVVGVTSSYWTSTGRSGCLPKAKLSEGKY